MSKGNLQEKRFSFLEAALNALISYTTSFLIQLFVFPLFNIQTPIENNFKISLFFAAVSILRVYSLRRIFTRLKKSKVKEFKK